ncbi:hypothetical protein POJ06DRAFT_198970 [Lipomyces tetrasporus]|uniref:F-box domain-containing protein n=1 Tax=Lipomyces tetrasporus TaxID=54092 RepID=A0AAD7QQW7_9ASCO|nr:uncharacterized protein POJ06DRAFT_198970 [Lipomyces tetrasporus]KAJ8099351.1 hypothetical protein POJ06DRAFT_198970 [Lipomyces tetrasporus]
MVKHYKNNAKGYLRGGKVHQLMGNDVKALQFYDAGLKSIDKNDKLRTVMKQMHETVSSRISKRQRTMSGEALSNPKKSEPRKCDMMQLPVEIVELILRHIPFPQIVRLQEVCRSWQSFILNSPRLWSILDFRQCNKKSIRRSTLWNCLLRAGGSVNELYLYNIWPRDASLIGNAITPYLKKSRLQVLHVDFNINVFLPSRRGHALSDTDWASFSNLTVLKIGGCEVLEEEELVEVICQARFPSLRVLHFYGSTVTRPKSFLCLSELDIKLRPTNLQSLIIENSGPGMLTHTEDLVAFLQLFPHLISLYLSNFVISGRETANRHLDFATITPQLVEFSLIHSLLYVTLTVPPTCQKFAIPDSALTPRTTTRQDNGVEVYSDDGSCVANPDEYRNLRHLDISSNTVIKDEDILGALSRCDGRLLQRLDMHACPKITANTVPTIARICPALRVLLIGHNSWLNDSGLAALHTLRELEYLDISFTDVTFEGILLFLAGLTESDVDANGKRIIMPHTTLTARIQERVHKCRSSDGSSLVLPLKALVMNSCTGVSLQSSNWIRRLGVHVDHDVSTMYDYINRSKKKRKY